MKPVRTRIAPSPTGNLHVGTAHTALFNYLFARHNGGTFIVRSDDSDPVRSKREFEQNILDSLKWLGITWDEGMDVGGPNGPYRQSERLPIYTKYIQKLLDHDQAYYCYCTQEELEDERKNQETKKIPSKYSGKCAHLTKSEQAACVQEGRKPVIRFRTPLKMITFTDLVRGEISVDAKLIGDFIIARSDGSVLLNIATTIDDIEMKITHALRGEDFLSLTPRQILLAEALGHNPPEFAHLSFLYAPDRTKLSKRHGATSVSEYRDMGILPEAMVNYLATLGWSRSHGGNQSSTDQPDIFSVKEATESFNLKDVQKNAPIFDYQKLRWMNGEYLRSYQLSAISDQLCNFFKEKYPLEMIEKTWPLVRERIKTLAEYEAMAGFFFERPRDLEKPINKELLTIARQSLETCDWNHDAMEKAIREATDKAGMKAKDVFMELRLAVTGKTVGPPLLESLEILGKEETFQRLKMLDSRLRGNDNGKDDKKN